jgi:hypothetical protein
MNEVASSPSPPIDAQPFLGRSGESVHELLEQRRVSLRGALTSALTKNNIKGLVLESSPRSLDCWVKMVCWTPQGASKDVAARREVLVRLFAREQCRFPVEYEVELSGSGAVRKITSIYSLGDAEIDLLVKFVLTPRARLRKRQFPRFRPTRASLLERLQLPSNRPSGIERRWLASWRRFWLMYVFIGIALVFFLPWQASILGLCLIIASVAIRLRYPVVFEKRGIRPLGEPRSLLRYDSWQTVIPDLGNAAPDLRAAVLSDLKSGHHSEAQIDTESIWHWGLDSVVEREQIVLHFRRSILFIEIHAYGADLYVDWEAYLNFGVWVEKPAISGFEPGGSIPVIAYAVQTGVQDFGEYDVSDANFALEWVHAVIKRHLKRLLAEHKIDEDIDFTIIRENRKSVREAKPSGASTAKGKFRVLGRT